MSGFIDRERLKRMRNFQSQDWYPAVAIRPLTILIMLVIGDWKFLTPNRLTTIANLFKVATVVFLVPEWTARLGFAPWPATVWAVVFLQLGIIFDHLDGTMARYRRTFTTLGSFYDKSSDIVTWFAICAALGWRAYAGTGDAFLIILATGSAGFLAFRGYMKWLSTAEHEKLRWREAAADPAGVIARRTAPPKISEPPVRTAAEWLRWFGSRTLRIFWFEEMDLFFWVGLGLLLDRLTPLLWFMFVTQGAGFAAIFVYRHVEAHRVDLAMRKPPA
ncbi:MAG: CDP-alcohol phosphatidyltransferase family protein [Myxococcales bacterium]|nr:CDP-alcohol phosphatidyltransferase family protein [Myxococcales bacterium]